MPESSYFGLGSGGGRNLPNTSWKNVSEPVSSQGGFTGKPASSGRTDWGQIANIGAGFLKDYVDRNENKYQEEAKRGPYSFGGMDPRGFGGSQLFDNFSIYTPPPSHSPFYLPGESGGPSTGQRFARAGSGALSGALSGAAAGSVVPGIGTLAGAIIGGIGGGLAGGFG